jgi:hypothetical protein
MGALRKKAESISNYYAEADNRIASTRIVAWGRGIGRGVRISVCAPLDFFSAE